MADGSAQPLTPAEAALDEAYRRHRAELIEFVARTFGAGPPEPEDIVQSVFVKFEGRLKKPPPIENARALLYRMTHNEAIDHRRRLAARAKSVAEQINVFAFEHEAPSPERVVIDRDELAILEEAIRGLPERTRCILLQRQLEKLTYAEIGRRWGLSASGAKRVVLAGLAHCHAAMRGGKAEP